MRIPMMSRITNAVVFVCVHAATIKTTATAPIPTNSSALLAFRSATMTSP